MTTPSCSLSIRGLELFVHLGWPDNERQEKQRVLIDIDVLLSKAPAACQTDKLEDTYCYSILTSDIREKFAMLSFHLIEHLTYKIHEFVKTQFPAQAKIIIRVTKHPHIEGLTGGVCFSYGDLL